MDCHLKNRVRVHGLVARFDTVVAVVVVVVVVAGVDDDSAGNADFDYY